MILLLMRHGIAEEKVEGASDLDDAGRELTARGKKRVTDMARFLKAAGYEPTHIVASPRIRAIQTADAVRVVLAPKMKVMRIESLDFAGSWKAFVADIRKLTKDDAKAVVFAAGHEPGIGQFITQALLKVGDGFEVKKGGVAVLEWTKRIAETDAELVLFATHPSIRRVVD